MTIEGYWAYLLMNGITKMSLGSDGWFICQTRDGLHCGVTDPAELTFDQRYDVACDLAVQHGFQPPARLQ